MWVGGGCRGAPGIKVTHLGEPVRVTSCNQILSKYLLLHGFINTLENIPGGLIHTIANMARVARAVQGMGD